MHAQHELTRSTPWTFSGLLAERSRSQRIALGVGLSLLFAGLTVLGANIMIPMRPIPITLQTLFVLLAGASIGRGWGSLSQALYVGLGVLGLPFFAGGAAGVAILAGPTGGYLISFLVAPVIVGAMLRRSSRLAWQIASFTVGTAVIFACGVTFLTLTYTHDLRQALMVGLVPFLPGAIFKIAAATSIHRSSQALVRHYRRDAR
jgi:biotin transport system substrate-specific component